MKTAWYIGFVQQLGSLQRGKNTCLAFHSDCSLLYMQGAPLLGVRSSTLKPFTPWFDTNSHQKGEGASFIARGPEKEETYAFLEVLGFCCFVGCLDSTYISSIIRKIGGDCAFVY